ncbi:PREDICTED: B3 domain-containing [Prunus dulcis]|uniref:PREDICTED: B3 domain-containing n=1 Tax=Prunus dulcis TaxID=3755 RepID=A0A5E4FWY3_PRUDU|nr:PREDICTED: B3 domain-containing [Prunus dulcis]
MAAPFEKRLTETDTVGKLSLPIEWLRILPPIEQGSHEVKIYVSDGLGFYEFRCSTIKMGRYRKPFLQPEDWLKFVDHKGLKVGDKIILDSEPNDFIRRHFRITAQKFNHEDNKWVDV